jgi:hypothetical protein
MGHQGALRRTFGDYERAWTRASPFDELEREGIEFEGEPEHG